MIQTYPIKTLIKKYGKEKIFINEDYEKNEKMGHIYYYVYVRDRGKNYPCSKSYKLTNLKRILKNNGIELDG